MALWHHHLCTALMIGAIAIASLVVVLFRPALVQPGVFDAGGFTSALGGLVRMMADPITAALGIAAGIALVVLPRAPRSRVANGH